MPPIRVEISILYCVSLVARSTWLYWEWGHPGKLPHTPPSSFLPRDCLVSWYRNYLYRMCRWLRDQRPAPSGNTDGSQTPPPPPHSQKGPRPSTHKRCRGPPPPPPITHKSCRGPPSTHKRCRGPPPSTHKGVRAPPPLIKKCRGPLNLAKALRPLPPPSTQKVPAAPPPHTHTLRKGRTATQTI